MPWAFKLCLAKVTGPSLVYMTVGLHVHMYTVNRSCLERLPGWVFWQLLTALTGTGVKICFPTLLTIGLTLLSCCYYRNLNLSSPTDSHYDVALCSHFN